MAIEQEMTVEEMQEIVFPHPSVSEILKESMFSL
jgi:dihydrolipoamide dehydrogenase